MDVEKSKEGMLSPYRVLDLTDEKGQLCGKLFSDLGADVIKVEPPGGDPARKIRPFYHDEIDPEKSLFWFAFNTGKRSITLDLENNREDRETFKKLVSGADFVFESYPPGYMEGLGLGYKDLEAINPGVILVSITPFGQTGPYKDYKASDIVLWAMGGQMLCWGDTNKPPIRISHHSQSYLHAGAQAALGGLIALQHRNLTSHGQHIDVSIQASVLSQISFSIPASWDMVKKIQHRGGLGYQDKRRRYLWHCKDGYVCWMFWGGLQTHHWTLPLIRWMEKEGKATDFLLNYDWDSFDLSIISDEDVSKINETTANFFKSKTKAELMAGAVKNRVMLYPVSTTKDILESLQLAARNFWEDMAHPELGVSIRYPGHIVHSSETFAQIQYRAPFVGEHNSEINSAIFQHDTAANQQAALKKQNRRTLIENENALSKIKPLQNIRVIDFTWAIAGPLTGKILSDWGAEVIKVESEKRPDPHREAPPFKDGKPGINRGGSFNQKNTSKLNISVDLTHPRGVEIIKQCVARADIVIENFASGVMKKLKLDYDELKKVKPDIIMLSSCMQGQTGPYATHPGVGYSLTALSGFTHIAGWPDVDNAWLDAYTDYISPLFNGIAILSALDYRNRTGKGQYLDMSQYENGVYFLAPLLLDYVVNGRVAERIGNRNPSAAPHNAYKCQGEDRWCAIAIFDNREWQSLINVMGKPQWAQDDKFATLAGRKANEEELDNMVGQWTLNFDANELMTLLQEAGVPTGVLQNGQELLEDDPQLRHRNYFRKLIHPEIGEYYGTSPAFILSKVSCDIKRSSLLGEHTSHILKNYLGYTDDAIAELLIEGIVS